MSTGGPHLLGRISKRGNRYLRVLFLQAARVVLRLRPETWNTTASSVGSKPPYCWIQLPSLHHLLGGNTRDELVATFK
jgi:Transposase IS116/IS110/IS902 family